MSRTAILRTSSFVVLAVLAAALLAGLALLGHDERSAHAALLDEVKKLAPTDGGTLGTHVAISGDIAVAGSLFDDDAGTEAGAAYIYERNLGGIDNWGAVKKLMASDAAAGDRFGYVAISGDTIVVGAPFETITFADAGAAYVFDRNFGGPDNWGEVTKLTASDAQTSDLFGTTVSISGDTIVVGAALEDAGGLTAGAAYVFERDAGGTDNWAEVKKLTASNAGPGDQFGIDVAISGDATIVGAYKEDGVADNAGAAYLFHRDAGGAGSWGEVKKITASDAELSDSFGWRVAIDATTAAVGAPYEDTVASAAGAAYVFERDLGGIDNWGEVKKVTASDASLNANFGFHVGISGDNFMAGVFFGVPTPGKAYLFLRNSGGANNWGEQKMVSPSDSQPGDDFGFALAISAGTALIYGSSAAYIFEDLPPTPTATPCAGMCPPTVTPTPTATIPNAPDLVIKTMKIEIETGGACNYTSTNLGVTVGFSNIGTANAGAFSVEVNGAQQVVSGGLAAGGELSLWFKGYEQFNNNVATVDVLGQVVEANEANNTVSTPLGVPTLPPTCTPPATPTQTPSPTPKDPFADTDGDGILNDVDPNDDNDGCTDVQENGLDETLGGRRNPHNPWDFYDVHGANQGPPDGVIDLFNDISSVISHYSPAGQPPYDPYYDRGPSAGPNQWNMTAPDGAIDLFNDISGVIAQFGHSCQ